MAKTPPTYGAEGSHPPEVISQDDQHRFVTDTQIERWDNGTAGQGQYMAMVFRRTSMVPPTPEGGTFNFPIPNGGLWTNSILPGIDPVFVSTRLFTSDAKAPQAEGWTPPVLFVKNGDSGPRGEKGEKGDPGIQGVPGNDGLNGADGVNGTNGTSIVWLGEAASHPIGAVNGNTYKNTTDKKSYVFWDNAWYQMTIDGVDGQEGISIVWKGGAATPPENPEVNWVYKNINDNIIYIYDGISWEVMVLDGDDGIDGADGENGLSVSIVYHDDPADGAPPAAPTTIDGVTGGWHTTPTSACNWMSQKVDQGTTNAWGAAIRIGALDGTNGISIVWKGDLSSPPSDPEINWVYRDSDNHIVYIYNGTAWEIMLLDGSDGVDGADGVDGLSVYITYHDADPMGVPPIPPSNVAGTNNGWHTNATAQAGWMSQKVDDGTGIGWSLAIPIRGSNGASGPRGSNNFVFDESDPGTIYITPAVAASWAGTLTNDAAQAVARDIILSGLASDNSLRPNDKITITDISGQLSGTRIYLGIPTNDYTQILASHFSGLVTELINGNMVIDGTLSAKALASDAVVGGTLIGGKLEIGYSGLTGEKPPADANNTATALSATVTNITSGGLKMTDSVTGAYVEMTPGQFKMVPASTGARMEITSTHIKVYDENGILRVQMGNLTT